jgi:pimeloyl-ACP methyl ester carboxylesterase
MQPRHHLFNAPGSSEKEPAGTHQIAYTEWGNPANPRVLVCVHGLTRNSRDFDHLSRELQEHYRILCVDVAGRGKSAWLPNREDYNYATYVADILALLKHLDIHQVDWVGTSMGGLIAIVLGAYHPQLIRKLVLNDIGPFIPAATLQRIRRYVSVTPEFATLDEVEKHLRTVLAPFGITDNAHWQHIAEHSAIQKDNGKFILAYDPAIAAAFNREGSTEIVDIDLWAFWEKLRCNILVLRGALSDALLAETAEKMKHTGIKTEVVEFPGIGHAPALMDDEQIKVVKTWLLG